LYGHFFHTRSKTTRAGSDNSEAGTQANLRKELPVAILAPQWLDLGVNFLRLSIWLPVLAGLLACRPQQTSIPATSGKAPRGCVWVADRAGQEGKLFLCGTIHILRESDYPLAAGYDTAYAQSTKLVLELPPGASSAPDFQTRLMELGQYPVGESLKSNVSPVLWVELAVWARNRGKDLSTLARLRPWLAALIITSTEYSALGAKAAQGVDQHFEAMATKDGKPGEGLETAELQFQLFSKLTPKMQEEMLAQTLAEVGTVSQEYEKMISDWKNGELDALHAMLTREAEKYPDLMDVFIKDRNRAWIDRLDAMLQRGEKVMVLVGLHETYPRHRRRRLHRLPHCSAAPKRGR
jgi:uncharacterized protein YbaP (TraB family)